MRLLDALRIGYEMLDAVALLLAEGPSRQVAFSWKVGKFRVKLAGVLSVEDA